jgi:hypothetical protein
MTEKKCVIRRPARPASERKISMNCFAAVPRGAEEIATAELQALEIHISRHDISFFGKETSVLNLNLWYHNNQ